MTDWIYYVFCRLFCRKSYQWIRVFADTPTSSDSSSWLLNAVGLVWGSGVLWAVFSGFLFIGLSQLHYHYPNYPLADEIVPAPSFGMFVRITISIVLPPLALLIFVFARRAKDEFQFQKSCHRLFHVLRNKYCTAMESDCSCDEKLGHFSLDACNEIERFFTKLLNKHGKNEIGCCIRIASKSKVNAYVTFGRSETVSETRSQASQPLPKNSGVAKAMLEKTKINESSVLLVGNIGAKDIVDDGVWKRLKARNRYHCDDDTSIQSQLICPINCRESKSPIMIGILFVTSSRKNFACPFKRHHGEMVAAIADVLGCLYQQTLKTETLS